MYTDFTQQHLHGGPIFGYPNFVAIFIIHSFLIKKEINKVKTNLFIFVIFVYITRNLICINIILLIFCFLLLFQVGDRVVALPDHKAWAELVAVPANSVFALPDGMSYLDATTITMNYTVAYILLFELANLSPGKSLLLHSAGGGVVIINLPEHYFFLFIVISTYIHQYPISFLSFSFFTFRYIRCLSLFN